MSENQPEALEEVNIGVEDFKKLTAAVPRPLRQLLLADQQIKACFVGIRPEIGGGNGMLLDTLSYQDTQTFISTLLAISNNFLLITYQDHDTGRRYYSLLNLLAAARVIQTYAQYFPVRAQSKAGEWLESHADEWNMPRPLTDLSLDIVDIRYGLLSGVPLESAVKYRPYLRARIKLDSDKLTAEEITFINDYDRLGKLPRTEENTHRMRLIVEKAGERLTIEEKELLLEARATRGRAGMLGFYAFSNEDEVYARRAQEVYLKSGIDKVR